MPRPHLLRRFCHAVAATVGLSAVGSALANPVDLWRVEVRSRQGEPLQAVAVLSSTPEENISDACLSLGQASELPGADLPVLEKASLRILPSGNLLEIRTSEPVQSPGLEFTIRIQCENASSYARHFRILIPRAATPPARASEGGRRGFRLSILRGDTLEEIAAVLFPRNRGLREGLIQQVIAGNPGVFPDGKVIDPPAGTVVWFPDLRDVRASSSRTPATGRKPRVAKRPAPVSPDTPAPPSEEPAETDVQPGEPVTLRRALALGEKPGPQECRRLLEHCGNVTAAPASKPEVVQNNQRLEDGIAQLRLRQEGIDAQLASLEQSLELLRKTAASAPIPSAPPPPKPEIRTVIQTEPIPWYYWAGFAALTLIGTGVGFGLGRKGSYSRRLADNEQDLDSMLATAARAMRDLDVRPSDPLSAHKKSAGQIARSPKTFTPPDESASSATFSSALDLPQIAEESTSDTAPHEAVQDLALKTQKMSALANLPASPTVSAPSPGQGDGLSGELLFELDQVMDNTRSMFTDVDRFIALGRFQNAITLLQFQVQKDPKDRESWIKLMGVYRHQKMDRDLEAAVRDFKRNFPNESPPA
ncbi:MAG: FimV family protein [Burkholderiales bacterium]